MSSAKPWAAMAWAASAWAASAWAASAWAASAWAASAIGLGACVGPTAAELAGPDESDVDGVGIDETALYRVGEGDSLSMVAERLSFPGGWHALARANALRGDRIREGAALRVPVAYLRDAGLDPYRDFGLERFQRPLAPQPLVPCRGEVDHGACATVGDTELCVEVPDAAAAPATGAIDDSEDDCIDEVDGATDCAGESGRVLISYRDGIRREIVALPKRGGLEVESHAVDLDGDGRPEIVAAVPIDLRNHEGWQSVRAIVIDERGALAASFDVAQWGEGSLVEASPEAGAGCEVLATSWEWVRHPLEGDAMYFVGRRLAWKDGALVPRGGEVLRRFRTYFHITCEACDGFGPQSPAAWLSDASASWWRELGNGEPLRAWERGTIIGAERVNGAVAFDVQLAGRRVRLDPQAIEFDDARPSDVLPLTWLRVGPTGAQLPDAFVPGDLARWIGAPAIVEERGGTDAEDSGLIARALWIDPI